MKGVSYISRYIVGTKLKLVLDDNMGGGSRSRYCSIVDWS